MHHSFISGTVSARTIAILMGVAALAWQSMTPALAGEVPTQAAKAELPKGLKGLSIGGSWFLSSQYHTESEQNAFLIRRAYLDIKKKINPWFSARITPDAHQNDEGDMAVRLKYLYGKFNLPDLAIFTKPNIEIGLVHMPWLDFEQKHNHYRMQDKMFVERIGTFNSADVGLTFATLLGGQMDEAFRKRVNSKYPGRYGSLALGVYNGGGYHAEENNDNKVLEGRLTLRPLPSIIPGLQLSYFGLFGKGNTEAAPDWMVNMVYATFEHAYFIIAGTYYQGEGNQKGKAVEHTVNADTGEEIAGDALKRSGYSVFAELRAPEFPLSVIGRFDGFDPNTDGSKDESTRIIAGLAYHFAGKQTLLFDYDQVRYEAEDKEDETRLQMTLHVKF